MEKTFFLRKKVLLVLTGHLLAFLPMLGFGAKMDADAVLGKKLFPEAQQYVVKGTVSDANGMPLAGVSVVEKGTTNGVATDFDGNYQISVAGEQSVLEFIYLGFSTQTRTVGSNTTINITLTESTSELDEVVVIG